MTSPRALLAGLFMSLDGVVQADDDWQYRWFDDELFASVTGAWERCGVAVAGRRSFEGYRSLRDEHPDSPMLGFLEKAERYVLSTTIADPGWPGTTVLGADALDSLAALRATPGPDVLVCGSPSVVRALLAADLLDELGVTVLPIVVGQGDRLFPESARDLERVPLDLVGSRTLTSGAVELTYRRARG